LKYCALIGRTFCDVIPRKIQTMLYMYRTPLLMFLGKLSKVAKIVEDNYPLQSGQKLPQQVKFLEIEQNASF
jgi:hypothetical protein